MSIKGHLAASKLLIKAGVDLEAATIEGYTPLHFAAGHEHWGVVQVLIEAGAIPPTAARVLGRHRCTLQRGMDTFERHREPTWTTQSNLPATRP